MHIRLLLFLQNDYLLSLYLLAPNTMTHIQKIDDNLINYLLCANFWINVIEWHLAWKTQEVVPSLLTLKQCLMQSCKGQGLVNPNTGLCPRPRQRRACWPLNQSHRPPIHKQPSCYSLRKYKQFTKLSGFHFPNISSLPPALPHPTLRERKKGDAFFYRQTRRGRPRALGSVRGQGSCWPLPWLCEPRREKW